MDAYLTINLDNAAFQDCNGNEIADILREIAHKITNNHLSIGEKINLRDYNGNTVGEFKIIKS